MFGNSYIKNDSIYMNLASYETFTNDFFIKNQ